jgi:hypothetical protein
MSGDLLFGEMACGAVVAGRLLGGDLGPAHGLELGFGLEGAIGGAVGEEFLDVFAVDFGALGLAIGAEGATDIGAFVPMEADPLEGVEDHLLAGGDEAGAVGVLDAENELAAALLGEDVIEQADVGGADVGVAGGRGSDADAGGTGIRTHCQLSILTPLGAMCADPPVVDQVDQVEEYCGE